MKKLIRIPIKNWAFIAILLLPFLIQAQIAPTGAPKDSTGAAIPTAIKTVNIIQKIEEANAEIKSIRRKIREKKDIKKIDSLFPISTNTLKTKIREKERFVRSNPNRQKINNLIKKWSSYRDYFDNWQSQINEEVQRNAVLKEIVDYNEKVWELTYDHAKNQKVPLEVLRSVRVVWNEFRSINRLITEESNKYLLLESRINQEKGKVNKTIDELSNLKDSHVYDLLYLRHLPLWKSYNEDVVSNEVEVNQFAEGAKDTTDFVKSNEHNVYIYIIIVIAIVLIIRFLRHTFLKYPFNEENGDLQNAKDIIVNHHIAVLIFTSLFIGNFYFFNAPLLFKNIVVLMLLILCIWVVKPYMYKRFKNIIYFLIAFYVLDSTKTYLWFDSFEYRWYLLLESGLVMTALYVFTHPFLKMRKMKIGRFGKFLINMTPLVYALVVTSVISNILGYTNLSDLTLKISTQSGVFTLVFYGILLIAGGISTGLIHRHYSTTETFDPDQKFKLELKLLQVIRVVAVITWFLFFLQMIDLLEVFSQKSTDMLNEPYKFGNVTITIGSVLEFIIILSVSFLITSVISFLFTSGDVSVRLIKLPKGVPAAISLVVRYFIIAMGIVLALSSLGIDLSKFNLMAGALGLGIGFGLQTVISNFVSGLILVFERPIHVGDTVEVNNLLGTVDRIGVRSSSVITYDGAEVVVPNNNLIANDLINWTLSDSIKRMEVLVGVTYGSDPNQVLDILKKVAMENENVLKNPGPQALFSEFADSSLNFRLRFWVHFELGLQTKSDVSIAIYNQFAEHGIEIPFPQQDVYIKDLPESLKSNRKKDSE